MQWSQLAILFGLMVLYLLHTPRFAMDDPTSRLSTIVPFLNLTAISFILATFTSRFVYPLVSLEGHTFWLVGMLPIARSWILVAKFSFAMTVTVSVATGVIFLASYFLNISPAATVLHWMVTCSICYGLCGCAVGLGARMPMLDERNPARIANGFGGTINLIASVLLIALMLVGMGYINYKADQYGVAPWRDRQLFFLCLMVIATGIIAGSIAIIIGARHLKRLEV